MDTVRTYTALRKMLGNDLGDYVRNVSGAILTRIMGGCISMIMLPACSSLGTKGRTLFSTIRAFHASPDGTGFGTYTAT